tara:strand:- start:3161 stop:4780 length:1620 start_codon:yes stop_codon:yes gene_type:complete
MPIIDPKTDLRSLSYKEFGTIGDPLVVKDIPGVNQDGPSKGVLKQVTARTDDALRMTRLLLLQGGKRNPAGNKFTANLALLNQQENLNKIQKGNVDKVFGEDGFLRNDVLGGVVDTGKTVASILAQVPVAGTGTHFVNGGKVGNEYLKGGGNAIGTILRGLVGADGLQGHERVLSGQPVNINRSKVDNSTTSLFNRYKNKTSNLGETKEVNPGELSKDPNLRQPFRLAIENQAAADAFKTRLIKHGDPGGSTSEKVDEINYSDILDEKKLLEQTDDDLRDLDTIPFYFQVYNPDEGGTAQYIFFRAYLTSLSDNFQGQWNSTRYIGRAEELYNYNGFSRSIGFGFNLAAQTRQELIPLYNKLNTLVGTTAPSYNVNQSFMRGVFTKVTIGDYLKETPGFFTNIDITWNTNYPWEIGLDENYQSIETIKVPHLLDINVQFQPVHDFNPEFKKTFIAGSKSGIDNNVGSLSFTSPLENNVQQAERKNSERKTKLGKFIQKTADKIKNTLDIDDIENEKVKTVNLNSDYTIIDDLPTNRPNS